MASSIFSLASTSTLLFVLVLQLSSTAISDIVTPPTTLPPIINNLCDEVNCGRGTCSVDLAKPFNFVCKCDPGWRRTINGNGDDYFQFLPCIIPNCSINYSCLPAARPLSPGILNNITFFDPCYWTYCGDGTCNRNLTTYYKYACSCNPGYTNLLNMSQFPCFSSCAIGADCADLGFPSNDGRDGNQGETTSSETSQGIRFLSGSFNGIGVIVTSVAMTIWI
ncbi:hypothetical protein QVD17_10242 [Tagetes erecta]|uniref:EGF-like domain-containing protein n=1 Tax=Tagetes erecta TaxID=13708 RepID=A0AAD8L7I9_TARER|nr:hypothetical protein QVD17_10242 [Tagetes erecta]